jgi:hypothetical protein
MFARPALLLAPIVLMALSTLARAQEPRPEAPRMKAGLIGLDTSHVIAFTQALNDPRAPAGYRDVRVVAAFPGGSPDLATSRDRVQGYTAQLRDEFHVEMVDSIEALLERVDVVLLESVDGRPHLAQAEPVLRAGKPLFIDKPVAASLVDTIRIFNLAEQTGTPCFSASSLRFSPNIAALASDPDLGGITGAEAYGPCSYLEHHPDLFFYGIHGAEALFTVMGPGCESVVRVQTPGADLVTGVWSGGRIGSFRGIRQGAAPFGVLAFGQKATRHVEGYGGYGPLLEAVCAFFHTRQAPVTAAQTIELVAFLEAADRSKAQGGTPVDLKAYIAEARKQAASAPSP